jgi:hypothetical protein
VLRQLARLTRRLDAAPNAVALAVYADASDVSIAATDRGHEGVACVDDAARALALLCDLSSASRLPVIRAWAAALLEFVLYMQDQDGRFVNFIVDWSGTRNEQRPTSRAGGSFWQARGLRGLAHASLCFDDARASQGVARGLAHARSEPGVAPAVRAIHVLTALDLVQAGRAAELRPVIEHWCAEIVECRRGGVLFDDADQSGPHLWAHVQEGALASAGRYLGRADLIQVARESALRYLAPVIDSGFDLPTVQPDGVASALFGVQTLAAVTGERRFAVLSERARAWFHEGVVRSRPPVYDRAAGRIHDGVDNGVLNSNSGAESNIAGAQALFPELVRSATTHRMAIERLLQSCAAVPPTSIAALMTPTRRAAARA